jgi:hypothetical protein
MAYEDSMSAEGLRGWECPKCGAEIDTESELMDLCGEPFNGTIITCPSDKCATEYDASITINIQEL